VVSNARSARDWGTEHDECTECFSRRRGELIVRLMRAGTGT